jgi:hypothetical protein
MHVLGLPRQSGRHLGAAEAVDQTFLKDSRALEAFAKSVIKKNHGFSYEGNVRRMLCAAVGEIVVCELEAKMDPLKKAQLTAELGALTENRNKLAHTYLKGVTHTIDAPSVTIARFHKTHSGFLEMEKILFQLIQRA